MAGVKAIGLGIIILVINLVMIFGMGIYLPIILPFAFPLLFAGPWILILGQPLDAEGKPAVWARAIVIITAVIGMLVGIAAAIGAGM